MSSDSTATRRGMLRLLRAGPFRRYIIGSAISDTGTWMQVMAQGFVMSTLTDRNLLVGLIGLAAGLPSLALTMIGGSVADRYDKRKILIATQIVQSILAITLGVLVLTGHVQIWHIVILAACLGVCIAFEMPALNALVPELVKKDEIATAIALDRSVFHGSRLLGPSLAGFLISVWGRASAFFCNAVSFFALVISLVTLPPRVQGSAEEEAERSSGFMEGLRYVRKDKVILYLIVLIASVTLFVYPVVGVMLPLYVKNVLHLGPQQLGFLMGFSGTGSLLGALGLLSIPRKHRFAFMTGGVFTVAAALFCLGRFNSFLLTASAMGILAIGLSLNFGLANTIVQERAPAPLRGRISAVFGLSFFGLMPLAGLGIPALADLIGTRLTLSVSAIAFAAIGATVLHLAGRRGCEEALAAEVPHPVKTRPVPEAAPVG
ncbi:MAG: MFS transporter [Verrucomicrobiota bacterium]